MSCVCQVVDVIVDSIRITVLPEKRIELAQTISCLRGPMQNLKGCRTIRFYVDTADENSSLVMSEWETESDYLNYLRSDDFAILKGAITVLSSSNADSKALVPFSLTSGELIWLQQQDDLAGRDNERFWKRSDYGYSCGTP